jgi:beta-glucosidase
MAFPDGFLWGTGASSTQTEGAPPLSDWAAWERAGRAPRSGDGNGFATRYAEDFDLYRSLGLIHHRLSLPWARIEPAEGRFDHGEVERYRVLLGEAKARGISVWVCLHHFTIPGWFEDAGGFADERAAGYFWPRWVDRAAELFGDLVHGWKPINEPVAYATIGWLQGLFPPGRRDPETFWTVMRLIHVAWRDAARLLRGAGQPIATVANLSPVVAADDSPEARAAARTLDEALFGIAVRLQRDGVLALPGRAPMPLDGTQGAADLFGFSYYSAFAVDGAMNLRPYPPDAPLCALGYAHWPAGLSRVLERLAEEMPDQPLLVSELGIGTTDDRVRVAQLQESLQRVEAAIADGIDVRGVFFWTGVDNYEWNHGWRVPFGIIERDRTPRPSAALVADTVASGTVPAGGDWSP